MKRILFPWIQRPRKQKPGDDDVAGLLIFLFIFFAMLCYGIIKAALAG